MAQGSEMSTVSIDEGADTARELAGARGPLIYRQSIWTRLTHWVWVVALFFLLLSGLQIFNAHPALYWGEQGYDYQSDVVLSMTSPVNEDGERWGRTILFGQTFDTTGVFGLSGDDARRGFPAWATIPSRQDLATGRVVHFFFGWVLVAALFIWFLASLINGHLRRDLWPRKVDFAGLPKDVADHVRFRFSHGRSYGPLQKFTYGVVFLLLFPLIILTGLTMSPGFDAAWPWLLDLFGGRQSARTIHFGAMVLLVLFFIVHILMVIAAGPINELRSMITGWYRSSVGTERIRGDRS